MKELLQKATQAYNQNFKPTAWFGRCIFLSWYCDVGTCNFCYRSTVKDRIKHAQHAKRSISSIAVEALLAKHLGWRIEFLTGGYKIFPIDELVKITKLVSEIYGKKIWLNLGALKPEELEKFKPYIEGIAASIETIDKDLHDKICPNKPIEPYIEMLNNANDLKKSITIVIGLGENESDIEKLHDFIKQHNLDRITFYALKPIKGTPYTKGPETDYYASWIAKTRIKFPKLEIIAGVTPHRVDDVDILLKAGANAITKFPATKLFNSERAKLFEQKVADADRKFTSTLTKLPDIDWNAEIDKLQIKETLKAEIKEKLNMYLKRMLKPKE